MEKIAFIKLMERLMLKGKIINKTIIYNLLDTQFITN